MWPFHFRPCCHLSSLHKRTIYSSFPATLITIESGWWLAGVLNPCGCLKGRYGSQLTERLASWVCNAWPLPKSNANTWATFPWTLHITDLLPRSNTNTWATFPWTLHTTDPLSRFNTNTWATFPWTLHITDPLPRSNTNTWATFPWTLHTTFWAEQQCLLHYCTHTQTHTYTHAHAYTHIHTHTHTQTTHNTNLWVQCETLELRFLKCSIKWDVLTFCFSPVSASLLHSFYSLVIMTEPYASHDANKIEPRIPVPRC